MSLNSSELLAKMFLEMCVEEEILFYLQLSSLVPAGEKKWYLRSSFLICTETYGKDCNIVVALELLCRSMIISHLRYFVPL